MNNTIKKPIALLLIFVMVFNIHTIVFADEIMEISIPSVTTQQGKEFEVPIIIKNNPGTAYISIGISFDNKVITPIAFKSENTGFTGLSTIDQPGIDKNQISMIVITWDSTSNVNANGTLGTLTFKANSTNTSTPLTLIENRASAFNEVLEDVSYKLISGNVTVKNSSDTTNKTESTSVSTTESTTEPTTKATTTKTTTESTTEPTTKATTTKTTTESTTEPTTKPTTTKTTTESTTELTTEDTTKSPAEGTTEPTTVTIADSSESTSESTSSGIIEDSESTSSGTTENTTESTSSGTTESTSESTTEPTTGENPDILYGDADDNGKLEAADAAMVLQKVLKNTFNMTVEKRITDYMSVVDVDRNNDLNAADSAMILQKVLKNTFKMTCETV